MKTLVWDGPDAMHVEDAPEPGDPGPGELILRPEAVGICGSEVEGYLGHMGNRIPPLVMGHEFAGTVVAAGSEAKELDGARVAVNPLSGCGECRLCTSGFSNLCKDRVLVGVHVPGAFAGLREGARRRRARAARRRLRPRRRADGAAGQRRPRRAPGAARRRERGRARRGHDRARHAPGRAAGRHPARRGRRAAGRAARARAPRSAPTPSTRRPRRPRTRASRTWRSTRSARRPRARWGWSCCAPAGRWSASASPPTTRRSASTA